MKTKISTEVAHVTRDSDTSFKVKRSKTQKVKGHQAALLTAAFMNQAAAAVRVETYWLGEPTATSPSAGYSSTWSTRPREALRRPQREERGGGI